MINKELNIPLYIQIYNHLKNEIIENVYEEEFLPPERVLSERYSVERATLRRALNLLVKDNLLVKIPGAGSKVNKSSLTTPEVIKSPSNNISFILPSDSTDKIYQPFIAALFYDFEKHCQEKNYSLFYTKIDSIKDLYERVLNNHIKGIIWMSKVNELLINKAKELHIPSVCVSNYVPGFKSILSDNYEGSYLAISHLVSLGHTNIAFINGIKSYLNAIERYTGYVLALDRFGYNLKSEYIMNGDWTFESGYDCMKSLIHSNFGITAVFAANDTMALGAIRAAYDCGLSVPEDISVVGFDNINQGKYFSPALTTIDTNIRLFAYEIFHAISQSIENEKSPSTKVLIPSSLIIRDSTKAISK